MAYQEFDPRVDQLFKRNIRCPYCKSRIHALESSCSICGVSKKQIVDASNARAKQILKDKTGEKVVMTTRRPDDVKLSKMCIGVILGIVGVHNFFVGRKARGIAMILCFVSLVLSNFIFPIGPSGVATNPFRASATNLFGIFPFDIPGIVAVIVWFMDCFAIVFGTFRYPVRLGEGGVKRVA
jgi:hypothetical protein